MKALLILHGWGSCAKNWGRVKELLENQGCKVFLSDLPGFGENPLPLNPWSLDDYAEWVKEFCEKNDFSQFFLLGHSFGGRIAIKFAVKFPEKLKGMILASAAGVTKRKLFKNFIFTVLAKGGKLVFRLPILNKLQPLFQKIIYKLAGSGDYLLAEESVMKETMRKVISEDLRPFLPKIGLKTLIIWGNKDKLTPISDAYLMKEKIKNSVLEVIPNVGHGIHLEVPEILVEKILNFIEA